MFSTLEVRATLARYGGSLVFTPSIADESIPWTHPTPGPHATAPHAAVMVRRGLASVHACSLVWGGEGWTRDPSDERATALLALVMADRLGDA